jgi:hypothetical protein
MRRAAQRVKRLGALSWLKTFRSHSHVSMAVQFVQQSTKNSSAGAHNEYKLS